MRTQDVEVAGLAAERPRVAFAGEPDSLTVVDAGRDLDVERPFLEHASGSAAALARVLDDSARAAATAARLAANELAEGRPRHELDAAGAGAIGARRRARAGLDAVSPTLRARNRDLERDGPRDAGRRLFERDLDLGGDVGAAGSPRAGRDAEDVVPEERREDVGQAPEVERRRAESRRSAGPRDRTGRRAARVSDFESTSYASTTSLNRSFASGASETSGWTSRASRLKARLISASGAERSTPRIS